MPTPKLNKIILSKAAVSTANWQYNQSGQTYNQAGVEYGGSELAQDIGPQNMEVITE